MFDFSKKKNYYYFCSVANISRGVLGNRVNPDTCRVRVDVQNSIRIRMGVDMEMLESEENKTKVEVRFW